jgi:AcrR family transcriptional regulator
VTAYSARERLLEAAYACVARYGIGKTTMEDVAREAKVSRATVYRTFPTGKDQLVREVVAWEAARFFQRLAAAVDRAPDVTAVVEEALVFAHRAIDDHAVLQKILQTEPELLIPLLTGQSEVLVGFVRTFLLPRLADAELRPGLTPGAAADYVARMVLSFIGSPGQWDLYDGGQVTELVRTELLAGVLP